MLVNEQSFELERAECLVDGLYTQFPIDELAVPEPSSEVIDGMTALMMSC